MAETELLLSDDSYNRWCQIHTLKRLYHLLKEVPQEDTSFQINNYHYPLKTPKYGKHVIFFCGDESGVRMPDMNGVDLQIREVNHKLLSDMRIVYKPLPINARNTSQGNDNSTEFAADRSMPMAERPIDLLFVGQVHVDDRREMIKSLKPLHDKGLLKQSVVAVTDRFAGGVPMAEYSRLMKQAKIVLVPKGGAPETFRYAEAMANGCIVVTTYLDRNLWYYEDSPAFYVNHWNEFDADYFGELLQLPEHILQELSDQSAHYFDKYLSDEAVARYVAERITW